MTRQMFGRDVAHFQLLRPTAKYYHFPSNSSNAFNAALGPRGRTFRRLPVDHEATLADGKIGPSLTSRNRSI
jgi:hypothetical protein